jgi:hypothetical protein
VTRVPSGVDPVSNPAPIYFEYVRDPLSLPAEAGRAVFPISTRHAFDRLAAVCGLHHIPLLHKRDRQSPVSGASLRRGELVASIGDETSAYAELYASLTGRESCSLDWKRPALSDAVKVIVLPFERWTSDLIALLQEAATHSAQSIGILMASSPEALLEQVLCRAAVAQGPLPSRAQLTYVMAEGKFGLVEQDGSAALGAEASRGQVLQALAGGSDILFVYGHSDGLDMQISGGQIICGYRTDRHSGSAGRLPACLENGACLRLEGKSVDEAWLADRLIAPQDLSAKIIFYESCCVVEPVSPLYDPSVMLSTALLTQAVCGASIACDDICISNPRCRAIVARELRRSAPVGTIVGSLNAMEEMRELGRYFFLFGDPDFQLSA